MATTQQAVSINFPKEDEITLTLRIHTGSAEDRDYFLLESGEIQPGFLADLFDMLDMISAHIVTINGKSYKELHKILQNTE